MENMGDGRVMSPEPESYRSMNITVYLPEHCDTHAMMHNAYEVESMCLQLKAR